MCEIQNVVRCFTADYDDSVYPPLTGRDPSKEEIHCCSIYTQKALEKQQAKVHLVFGEVAAKALLANEYKKGRKSFWSDRLGGHVMCLYHPSYFIRQGYGGASTQAPNAKYKQWRADIDHALPCSIPRANTLAKRHPAGAGEGFPPGRSFGAG
jgi:uracil-DNA glycosylase family 4